MANENWKVYRFENIIERDTFFREHPEKLEQGILTYFWNADGKEVLEEFIGPDYLNGWITSIQLYKGEDGKVGRTGNEGVKGPRGYTGFINITVKNTWNPETAYFRNDLVFYNDFSWVAVQNVTGEVPPSDENPFWEKFIAVGVGPQGETGRFNLLGVFDSIEQVENDYPWVSGEPDYSHNGATFWVFDAKDDEYSYYKNWFYDTNNEPAFTQAGYVAIPRGEQGIQGLQGQVDYEYVQEMIDMHNGSLDAHTNILDPIRENIETLENEREFKIVESDTVSPIPENRETRLDVKLAPAIISQGKTWDNEMTFSHDGISTRTRTLVENVEEIAADTIIVRTNLKNQYYDAQRDQWIVNDEYTIESTKAISVVQPNGVTVSLWKAGDPVENRVIINGVSYLFNWYETPCWVASPEVYPPITYTAGQWQNLPIGQNDKSFYEFYYFSSYSLADAIAPYIAFNIGPDILNAYSIANNIEPDSDVTYVIENGKIKFSSKQMDYYYYNNQMYFPNLTTWQNYMVGVRASDFEYYVAQINIPNPTTGIVDSYDPDGDPSTVRLYAKEPTDGYRRVVVNNEVRWYYTTANMRTIQSDIILTLGNKGISRQEFELLKDSVEQIRADYIYAPVDQASGQRARNLKTVNNTLLAYAGDAPPPTPSNPYIHQSDLNNFVDSRDLPSYSSSTSYSYGMRVKYRISGQTTDSYYQYIYPTAANNKQPNTNPTYWQLQGAVLGSKTVLANDANFIAGSSLITTSNKLVDQVEYNKSAVKLTGDQTVAGVKSFSSNPKITNQKSKQFLSTDSDGQILGNGKSLVTSWSSIVSDNNIPSEKLTYNRIETRANDISSSFSRGTHRGSWYNSGITINMSGRNLIIETDGRDLKTGSEYLISWIRVYEVFTINISIRCKSDINQLPVRIRKGDSGWVHNNGDIFFSHVSTAITSHPNDNSDSYRGTQRTVVGYISGNNDDKKSVATDKYCRGMNLMLNVVDD